MATAPDPARPGPVAAVRTGLIAAVALVLGLFAGALVVGLLAETDPPVAARADGPAAGEVPGGDLPEGGASAGFVVNGPCLGAVNAAQDAYLVMDDLGAAAAALDAARLDEVVRRLQPLQARLQDDLDACRVSTELAGGQPRPAGAPASPTGQGDATTTDDATPTDDPEPTGGG
jgi:hypothetical protein